MQSMETVYIYDIKSKKWLKQETTAGGRGPEPRVHFCAVVASSQDKSSHNIYVTHEVGIDATTAETIHVLSIPSFQWVTVPNPLVTFGTNCHRLGERYMVAFGRIMTFDLDAEPRCMQATDKGQVNIFDLSELVWTRKLDNHPDELPYEVPEQVFKVIGGGYLSRNFA